MSDPWDTLIFIVVPSLSILLTALAVTMFLVNLPLFRSWRTGKEDVVTGPLSSVSVLIPARNEAGGIAAAIESVLASEGVELDVVVMDDGSTDGTGQIVRSIASRDPRVRLLDGIGLPDGWNGKQHACYRLAAAAHFEGLMFIDADVRLRPTALRDLLRRKANGIGELPIGLLSAFPRQETGTLFEKMLIPMMHFILLCYLPFMRMRGSVHPAYASGCGQLFLTDKASYEKAGTHKAIRSSRHDGLMLPKAFRENGMLTDCVDGTDIASCRMYTNAKEVIRGLLKNANEGIANRRLLVPFTILLGGAHLLPWLTLVYALSRWESTTRPIMLLLIIAIQIAVILVGYIPRVWGAIYLRQSWLGALLHPVAVLLFLGCQWWAMINEIRGKRIEWRGRS
ncbi:glycosyltransferase [Neorhodopirellula pilleata]|uniref:4,4'-diaponeurosporenoate glycosyltransferase n=1 Tax=Neorhodopirellula pilleata TaxID=2714738 RepID=A0A5C6AVK7_9BACT|nr:glycosyltransferase [Neorhodopirellula pilleata]TWU03239.1 4,4'-diaponeurosporenoate glycosyltransferase [Neorhodopirellula pilleata]